MLARMSMLLTRLGAVWTTLPCPDCRSAMTLRADAPVAGPPVTVERVYECRACGKQITRHWLWAIPD
jgi:predicted RNA-binding Zn-ribbon protein involved in translation (DUF1610 family)